MEKTILDIKEVRGVLKSVRDGGATITLGFRRAYPVCSKCWKRSHFWKKGVNKNCSCGGEILYDEKVECHVTKLTGKHVYYINTKHSCPRMSRIENVFFIGAGDKDYFFLKKR